MGVIPSNRPQMAGISLQDFLKHGDGLLILLISFSSRQIPGEMNSGIRPLVEVILNMLIPFNRLLMVDISL